MTSFWGGVTVIPLNKRLLFFNKTHNINISLTKDTGWVRYLRCLAYVTRHTACVTLLLTSQTKHSNILNTPSAFSIISISCSESHTGIKVAIHLPHSRFMYQVSRYFDVIRSQICADCAVVYNGSVLVPTLTRRVAGSEWATTATGTESRRTG